MDARRRRKKGEGGEKEEEEEEVEEEEEEEEEELFLNFLTQQLSYMAQFLPPPNFRWTLGP